MRFFKLFIITVTLIFFTTLPFDAQAVDCSDYKKLSHEWNKCKLGILKKIGEKKEKTNSSSEENSTTAINQTEDKEGVLGGLLKGLKKIREFGGKKVGESG